mmetsp:Transcript_60367/g.68817  ORF Transcript_60367/g.68817 Transcript_60367/m.68817 type:complete len:414 (+) Transcript_60367:59-1300(+)
MASRSGKLFKNHMGRFLPVLDRTHFYPSLEFPSVPGYNGRLYVGETLVDSARHYSDLHSGGLFASKESYAWEEEIEALVDKFIPEGDTRYVMRFLKTNGILNTISSYLTIGFLSSLKIDTIVTLQEVSEIELDRRRMKEYREAMRSVGVDLIHFPIRPRHTLLETYPDDPDIIARFDEKVIQKAVASLADTKNVYVHCKEGRGRSGGTAASIMLRMLRDGGRPMDAETLVTKFKALREESFNNDEEELFLTSYEQYLNKICPLGDDAVKCNSNSEWSVRDLSDLIRKPVLDAIEEKNCHLNLWRMDLSPNDACSIAKLLRANCVFTNLTLFVNKIGDEGAKELADVLKTDRTLKTIDLGDNEIGDEGAKELTEALKENEGLEKIYLHNNPISEEYQQELRKICRSRNINIEIW